MASTPHEEYTHILCVLYSKNLFSKVLKVVEGGLCCDGVYEGKALAIFHVQVSHRCELFLHLKRKKQRGRINSDNFLIVYKLWLLPVLVS